MLRRRSERFDTNDPLQDGGGLRVFGRSRDNAGAVDQVYPLGEGDILPDLRS